MARQPTRSTPRKRSAGSATEHEESNTMSETQPEAVADTDEEPQTAKTPSEAVADESEAAPADETVSQPEAVEGTSEAPTKAEEPEAEPATAGEPEATESSEAEPASSEPEADESDELVEEVEALEPIVDDVAASLAKVYAVIQKTQEQAIQVSVSRAGLARRAAALDAREADLVVRENIIAASDIEIARKFMLEDIAAVKADYAERNADLKQREQELYAREADVQDREAALRPASRGGSAGVSGSKGGRPAKDPHDIEWAAYPDYEKFFPQDAGKQPSERRNMSGEPWTRGSISVAMSRKRKGE